MSIANSEVGAVLGRFFFGGAGPSHSVLTSAFARAGYASDDPYDPRTATPNKQQRVQVVFQAAERHPARGKDLVEAILSALRVHGCFDTERSGHAADDVRQAQKTLARAGWLLDEDGHLSPLVVDVSTGGREALDEQLNRLRRSTDDPALLIGTAKELLEAVAKFVLEEFSYPFSEKDDFGSLWFHARDRLGLHPRQVPDDTPGAKNIKAILQSTWTIAESVNQLRNLQGTGHGRTLPTGVTADMALLVVREACSVAEFMLGSLDRTFGRRN
ncbi:abortive infection family protein [Actinoplanes sp. G11-F43]|uniref:abortive infection family protein n=1 Tax=Actinoplanes sp. G11-F43 TaxID=3424130 RepID=UPI003D3403A4